MGRKAVLRIAVALLLTASASNGAAPSNAQPADHAPGSHSARATAQQSEVMRLRAGKQADGLKPEQPGLGKNKVPNNLGKEWHPTKNPKKNKMYGKMRSDREPIPGGFTKEQADQAEIQEAQELDSHPTVRDGFKALPVNCRTYWPSPFRVCGAIRDKYDQIGGPASFLTWPKSNELALPDRVGRRNEFINGFIYWHPSTGAHPVSTHFSVLWARNGWETGRMGYPTSDEYALSDGLGRKQEFERAQGYGSVFGLAEVEGLILQKWQSMGAEKSSLGYPVTDEKTAADSIGRFNKFIGGDIYWHPAYGAHSITGISRYIWGLADAERGSYGYPMEDTMAWTGRAQRFSKKVLDRKALLEEAGLTNSNGKDVNKLVLEYSKTLQYAVSGSSSIPTETRPVDGVKSFPSLTKSVSIPSNYVYDPETDDHRGYHDYCTSSPDEFPSPGANADFKGPCARHDMCMEGADQTGAGYGGCNSGLRDDMIENCRDTYSGYDPRRYGCIDAADSYWVVVTAFHANNL